ncbi:hypothetical protein N7468_005383 [Penicillium chermesinum]|uniref:Mob1 family protein n=1 Tax=Penicillium chermesinum TaxID=63820 RepID=A0A9W9NZ74_9EURO|nr:uncharacterized protein N7468_005383 [Penicillium chermesinum]KAJ5232427.1 hypothetical protein N7468_005383 [Penicillium chermesinum]
MRHLTNIFRRLYRIFAHAWFQHRGVFWEVEGHDGLYVFFKTVCDLFHLIPEDNYTIPPEAEGPDATQLKAEWPTDAKRLTILRKEDESPFSSELDGVDSSLSTGATTRRHKHSPSTGSRVTTIAESTEDNDEAPRAPAPLREVTKEILEPHPPSSVEDRPANEEPAPEPMSNPVEEASARETPAEATPAIAEAAQEIAEKTEDTPVKTHEELSEPPEEPTEQPKETESTERTEAAETAAEPKVEEEAEQTEAKEDGEAEKEPEKPLEGQDAEAAPLSTEDSPSESPKDLAAEAAAEA